MPLLFYSAKFTHLPLTALRHMVGCLPSRDVRDCLVALDKRFAAVSRHFLVVQLLRRVGSAGAPAYLDLGSESWRGVLRDVPDTTPVISRETLESSPKFVSKKFPADFYWRGRTAEAAQSKHEVAGVLDTLHARVRKITTRCFR